MNLSGTTRNGENPSYYSILIAEVRYDKRLPANAKLLYSEITALCNKDGRCWASNNYFANLYNVERRTIIRWINSLRDYGYIDSYNVYEQGKKEVKERIITINKVVTKMSRGSDKKVTEVVTKMTKGSDRNVTDNTKLNTKENKELSSKIQSFNNYISDRKLKIHNGNTTTLENDIEKIILKNPLNSNEVLLNLVEIHFLNNNIEYSISNR